MVQLTRAGCRYTQEDVDSCRAQFEATCCLVLPGLIEPQLAATISRATALTEYEEQDHTYADSDVPFGHDATAIEGAVPLRILTFVLNHETMLQFIREATGRNAVRGFAGRVFRMRPNESDHLDWHDDRGNPARVLGVSVSLGTDTYSGGVFQLRRKAGQRMLAEVPCQPVGTAHVFLVSPALEHRVTNVDGPHDRVAAAGWFLSEPDAATILHGKLASNSS